MSAQPVYEPEFGPLPWKWTRELYYLAGEYGFFRPDQKTELLDGEVFVKVSPQKTPHATAISLTLYELDGALIEGRFIRVQQPLTLDDLSEPEPDLAVVRGKPRDYLRRHPLPQDVDLVLEVADTSLETDLTKKARLYATARVREYWVVNLPQGTLEVFTTPTSQGYREHRTYAPGAMVSASCLSKAVAVADLLPLSEPNG